ncbi:apolipoprotein N-acyltransferase [Agreia sp. PsM10]|uniref:apolipoprotein N-acyltransferase n=1 Tax=Agreia sp. PsM10 TaxID=3030533 RepID=UPI00263B8169|nr:apolipoprotein N-acyltransferase [Agreia sp. PsM10]MDN4639552.1 apolipoprotein N-acyltransferase [Agreia sp. PsM10]
MVVELSPPNVAAHPAAPSSRPRPGGSASVRLPGPSSIPSERARPIMPYWLALLTAAAGGVALDTGFPDKDVWPVTFLGIGLVLVSLIGRRLWGALLIGLVGGFSFWGVHIFWLTLYLGPIPWLALAILQSLFFAVGAALIAVVYGRASITWPGAGIRLLMLPVVVAGLWTAREALTAVWPEGGFSWGRVVFSQSESPYASLVGWIGFSGLSFVMVWLVAFLVELARTPGVLARTRVLWAAVAVVATLAVPAWYAPTEGTSRIAAVQGNTDASLFSERAAGDVLSDQTAETLKIIDQRVDMVVWPENGSDLDPARSQLAADQLDYLSEAMNAPFIVGTITNPSEDTYFNTSLLWKAGSGSVDHYDKRHPVPFAEYMPARAIFRAIVPDLVDLVTRDYSKGTTDTVFDINGVIAGISICFDITDDAVAREMMGDGAQVILAQTNNADFGKTDENLQQLAIARLRAVETGRSVVNISTVGTSAIIAPDGSTIASVAPYEAGSMIADVPLATRTSPATLLGAGIELLVSGLGLAGLVLSLATAAARRRVN